MNHPKETTGAGYLGKLCNLNIPAPQDAATTATVTPYAHMMPPQASNNTETDEEEDGVRLYPTSIIPKVKPKKPVWLLHRAFAIDESNVPTCGEDGCDATAHAIWKPEEAFNDEEESSSTSRFLCMSCQMRVMYGFPEDPVPLVSAPLRKPYPGEIERMERELDHLLDEEGKQKQVRFQQNRIDDDGDEDEDANENGHDEAANGAKSGTGGEMRSQNDDVQEGESKDTTGTSDDEAGAENEAGNNDDGEEKKVGTQKKRRNKDVVDLNATELPSEHVEQWRELFEEMCEYKRFTGNCVVPMKFDHRLSKWVSEQRQRYKMMRNSSYRREHESYLLVLSREEESLLRGIGFVFDASEFRGKKRDREYESKQKDFLRYMKSKMKKRKAADDVSDDEGIADSKVACNSADKVNDNEEIGPDNDPRDGSDDDVDGGSDEAMSEAQLKNFKAWYEMYEELRRYKSENGDCRVPFVYHGDEERHLGYWVAGQRKRYKSKKMSKKEVSLLDGIGFIWETR